MTHGEFPSPQLAAQRPDLIRAYERTRMKKESIVITRRETTKKLSMELDENEVEEILRVALLGKVQHEIADLAGRLDWKFNWNCREGFILGCQILVTHTHVEEGMK
jgi:hypothetical protein